MKYSKVETITPAIAKKYLATQNTHENNINRKIQFSRVAQYAEDMRRGLWVVTHQGIAFDENNELMDGQHRLEAVVLADVPVDILVSRGVPRSAFWFVDGGYRRSTASFLTGKYSTLRAAAAKAFITIEESNWAASSEAIRSQQHSTPQILEFLETHDRVREYILTYAPSAMAATKTRRDKNGAERTYLTGTTSTALLVGGLLSGKPQRWWNVIDVVTESDTETFVASTDALRVLGKTPTVGGNGSSPAFARSLFAAEAYSLNKRITITQMKKVTPGTVLTFNPAW